MQTRFMMCVYNVNNKTCHPGVYNYALDVNDERKTNNNDLNNQPRTTS